MKNKFMRIAAVMLMLCLVTTCAISGTFAKYTTATAGQDTARVAYWGWTGTTINIENLFTKTYSNDVAAKNDDGLIAPGTGSSATFTITYTDNTGKSIDAPEVDYIFTVSAADSTCDTLIKNNKNIQWRLNVTENSTETEGTWGTWTALVDAINLLDGTAGAEGKNYDAGYLPEAFDNGQVYEIEWQWVFEGSETYDVGGESLSQDEYDTYMANQANLDDVLVKITISATQVNG